MARAASARARLQLRLYIAGTAPNSMKAVANAKAICETHFAPAYVLEIVDLLKHPHRALKDGVLVTPTLIRCVPEPVRRVIGNLSDAARVVLALETH